MIDTFPCIPFDLSHLIYKVELAKSKTFSFKDFLFKFKEADATSDCHSVLYVNI